MKREFLRNLKVGDQPLSDETIDAAMEALKKERGKRNPATIFGEKGTSLALFGTIWYSFD